MISDGNIHNHKMAVYVRIRIAPKLLVAQIHVNGHRLKTPRTFTDRNHPSGTLYEPRSL